MTKIITQPLVLSLFLMTAAMFVYWITNRGRALALRRVVLIVETIALFALAALSMPAVASLLCDSLAVPSEHSISADYIVVLAGGYSTGISPDLDALSAETTQRVLTAVHYWKQRPSARLIMTGAVPKVARDLGRITELMADAAICHGVPATAIVRETAARNTRDHPLRVLRLAGMRVISTLAIVTSRVHERRAVIEFRRHFAHVAAEPIPESHGGMIWTDWLPQNQGLVASTAAIQEWIGIIWYEIRALADGSVARSR